MRQMTKEDLLSVDKDQVYDREFGKRLEAAVNYRYPHMDDTGLYAMVSVSELKKQSQIGRSEEAIGTGDVGTEGAVPEFLEQPDRGTGYLGAGPDKRPGPKGQAGPDSG